MHADQVHHLPVHLLRAMSHRLNYTECTYMSTGIIRRKPACQFDRCEVNADLILPYHHCSRRPFQTVVGVHSSSCVVPHLASKMTNVQTHLCCNAAVVSFTGGTHSRTRMPSSDQKLRSLKKRVRCFSRSLVICSSTSSQLGFSVERARKQIFEDGFAVFPQMWSKEEEVMGREQKKVLESFLVDTIDVVSQRQWVHAPGHRCTDAVSSPEPYWHDSWQIAGLECEGLQMPPCSSTLIISLSDRNAKTLCGGVAVFPRSHWITHDRIANATTSDKSFPQPCDLPTAVPIELRLECGDMALLHPLLGYTIAPNTSSSPAQFLVFNLGHPASNARSAELMWSGWHSMEDLQMDETTSAEEVVQLEAEEGKAQLGGWQQNPMTGLTIDKHSSFSTRASPRDLIAWRLRTSALRFMQDGEWSNALSMLLRRAGLRPNCYWTTFQAGVCCMKSAPAGQLGGRAGRKCTLEDGERFLLRAIEIAPGWPLAYAELMRCLELMGRGREQEISRVMEVLKQRCNLEQLCLRYPNVSEVLQECWNDCEALCHRFTA